jgi:hypothetical protein
MHMELSTSQTGGIKVPETAGMSHAAQTTAEFEKIIQALSDQDAKINIILENSQKARRASVRLMWASIIFFVLPLILLVIAGPLLFNSLSLNETGLQDLDGYTNTYR